MASEQSSTHSEEETRTLDVRNSARAAWIYLDTLNRWAEWDRVDAIPPEDLALSMDDVIAFAQRIKALANGEQPSDDLPKPYPFYEPGVHEGLVRERDSKLWGVGALETPTSLVAKNMKHGKGGFER